LVGELAGVETGCGGSLPFEIVSTKGLAPESFIHYMQAQGFSGVSFSPTGGATRLTINPHANANLTAIGVYILSQSCRNTNLFAHSNSEHLSMFYKCYGSDSVRHQVEKGVSPSAIVAGWASNVSRFQSIRAPYLMYP